METRSGKIEGKAEQLSKAGKPYYQFQIDGMKYNSFDKKDFDEHNIGDFVQMMGEQKDQYWNMKSMSKMNNNVKDIETVKIPKSNGKEFHLTPEQQEHNLKLRKIHALKAAIMCFGSAIKENNEDEVMKVAKKFVGWIENAQE